MKDYLVPNEAGIDSEKDNCVGMLAALLEITDYISPGNFHGEGLKDILELRYKVIQGLRDQGYEVKNNDNDKWVVEGQYVNVMWTKHKNK